MPDTLKRSPSSASGKWFVDQDVCAGCRDCITFAPKNFELDVDTRAFVSRQPKGEKEEADCQRALEECPELAIGKEDDPKPKPRPLARRY